MRRADLMARVEEMRRAREPYALATVVRARRPTSAEPGDSALITADGRLDGFVGGASTLLRITPDTAAVVVASHGHGEEAVLAAALRAGVPYIALVASRARGDVVLASVGTDRSRVRSPAGLDIGARTAPGVARSILAEMVASR